jgi:CheY-like chemotaxis protein
MNPVPTILLAEDSRTDVMLLQRALAGAGVTNPVRVACDGQDVIDILSRPPESKDDRLPALIILDLKMPRRDGLDVLQWLRQQPVLRLLPVVVFSSSAHRDDIERAYALGANAFVVKPPSIVERMEFAQFIKAWLKFNHPPLAVTEGHESAHSTHAERRFDSPPGY